MAFIPLFTGVQNSGTPETVTFYDLSTGTDAAITQRRIFFLQSDGTYLTGNGTINYDTWAIADNSIALDVLTQDTALTVTVEWLNSSNGVLYDKETSFGFAAFGETFYYGLTQTQVPITNPAVALSTDYYMNKMKLRVLLDSAAQAITFASDIYSAMVCYDAETFMIANANDFF